MSQSRDGSLAWTKNDRIFLLVLKHNIGGGSCLFLKKFRFCKYDQYFLMILRAEGAEGVKLVMNGSLPSCFFIFLFLLSSKERSRNLTRFMLLSTNLEE